MGGGDSVWWPRVLGRASGVTYTALPHQAHERLEETKLEAVRDNNLELVQEILRDLAQLAEQSSTAAELARILQEPHFQVPARGRGVGVAWGRGVWAAAGRGAGGELEPGVTAPRSLFLPPPQSLLETHDSVASKTYETPPPSPGLDPTFSNQPVPPDAVRMVGIRKTAGEHLVRPPGRDGGGSRREGDGEEAVGPRSAPERAEGEGGTSFAQGRAHATQRDRALWI